MENINVTLGIDNESMEKLSSLLEESLKDSLTESIKNDIENDIEVDDHISNWMDYNFDIEDHLRNVNLNDYIDDVDIDIEGSAKNLLSSYSPLNNCDTAEAFTEAVAKAIRYLLIKDDEFIAETIEKALEKRSENKKRDELKASLMEEIKPLMFDEFKAELERYAAHLEVQKAQEILSQATTHVIPEIPTNNNGY